MKFAAVVEHEVVPDIVVAHSFGECLYLFVDVVQKLLVCSGQDGVEASGIRAQRDMKGEKAFQVGIRHVLHRFEDAMKQAYIRACLRVEILS